MTIQESGEMYLETILILSQKGDIVRSLDVAEFMGYSKPSVSRAVGLLKKAGYIEVEPSGHIALTERGNALATKIYDRHVFLSNLLIHLGVDEKIAVRDACKIEHDISDETMEALKKHAASILSYR